MATIEARRRALQAREQADSGRGWYAFLARTGLVAKGLSYGLVGALAVKLALGDGGSATSRQGAMQQLSRDSFGKPILILLAIGLAAYALWRFLQAFLVRGDGQDGAAKVWATRIVDVARGLIYAGLTYTTVRILTGSGGGQSQNAKAHTSAAVVLSWPGGRFLVGAVGLVLVAVAFAQLYKGLARTFEDAWRTGLSPAARRFGTRVGVVGHIARFVVFGLVGVFVTKAAIDFNPRDAIGLDGALQKLAHASYGPWLLGLTAAGLVAYGLFCLVDAALRDVSSSG